MEILELVKSHNGFTSFNPMQQKAIGAGLFDKNIVVSAPTASGKTIIAEICALNSILNSGKKVVYTCPLRALATEHANDFKAKYDSALSIKSVLSTGDFDSSGAYLGRKDIIFSTYEKVSSLLNHRADWLSQIGLLIVDEIHTIGSDRGPTLEILIAKLRLINPKMQILGLSATIPNAKELSEWLGAQLVVSDYRPVKLRQGVYLDGMIDFVDSSQEIGEEKDEMISLSLDTLKKEKQALVFVNTRKMSESIAKKLAPFTFEKLSEQEKNILQKASQKILNVLETPTLQCETLSNLVKSGVSFHNSGLLQKQREVVEELFKKNYLKFICCTTSLAAGVNTPAYRVIIHSPYRYTDYGMQRIPVSEYFQICGRAGRPKYHDTEGQAILIAKSEIEKDDYISYFINGKIENADSQLGSETSLRFHLLCAIATGFIFDLQSAEKFFSTTFYSKQTGAISGLFTKINFLISQLVGMGFVQTNEKRIDATPLGRRVAELYLDPLSASAIINALKNQKTHELSYLFTIANTSEFYPLLSISRGVQSELWENLQQDKSKLAINVDVEMFSDNELLPKYWTSLMLNEWIGEIKEQAIVDTYKVQPGILRAKLKNADWLAYSSLELAKILGLEVHFAPLNKMRKRLQSGIKEELIALCEFRGIGRVRARRLYNAGVKGVTDVKNIDVKDLEKILGQKVALSVKAQLGATK